jgi:LAS superfamily LD-carboxypeptidase LdcB
MTSTHTNDGSFDMASTDSSDDLINQLQRLANLLNDSHSKTSTYNSDELNRLQRIINILNDSRNRTLVDSNDTDAIQSSQNDASSKVKLIIHNQFPGTELVSPLYYSDGVTCCLSPDQKVDIGSTTQVGLT